MQASLGVLEVELVQFRGEFLVLIQEETREEVRDRVPVFARKFVDNFLQDAQVRTVSPLHKAIKQHDHLIQLEGVLCHHCDQFIQAILKEEEFSALRVCIQQSVRDVR